MVSLTAGPALYLQDDVLSYMFILVYNNALLIATLIHKPVDQAKLACHMVKTNSKFMGNKLSQPNFF